MRPFLLALALVPFCALLVGPTEVGAQDEIPTRPSSEQTAVDLVPPDPPVPTTNRTSPAGATRSGERQRVEEIVVSARKREELLEDTPISVTALGEATLREAGITRLDGIQELVPNLKFTVGRENQEGGIQIRGVGTSTGEIVFDPGVGVYVDGVFLPRSIGQLIDVLEVQQVEVLRGPQGTLFGKNTVGGAINITTVKPREDLEAFAFVRPGNFGSIGTRMMLNVPLWGDKILSRISFATQNGGGYAYNRYLDETWSNQNSLMFLGSLRIQPTDDLRIDLSGTWARAHSLQRGGQCRFVQPAPLGDQVPGFYEACAESEPFEFGSDVQTLSDTESYGTWGTIAWEPGDVGPVEDVVLKSITSWREQIPRHRADLDMTRFPVLQLSFAGGGRLDGEPWFQRQISQEVQANGSTLDGRLQFVGGFFSFWETGDAPTTVSVLPGGLDLNTLTDTTIDNFTWAFFGQATAELTEWASLTAGLRYTSDHKEADVTQYDVTPVVPVLVFSQADARTFTAWTPMASLALSAPDDLLDALSMDHLMGYFTYSQGFKGGGFNGVIAPQAQDTLLPFAPETLDSYEIGFKTISFDRRLIANVSLFYGLYDDIQVTTLRLVEDDEGNISQQRLTLNAAKATTKGAELEVMALPMQGVQVVGSIGLLDAKYDQFIGISDVTGLPIDRSGQTFNRVPQLQTHLSLQYSFPVETGGPSWLDGWLTPRLDWYYQSRVHSGGPELVAGIQPGYNLLHARLSLDFLDDRAQVALWGKNLLDTAYFDTVSTFASSAGIAVRYFQAPRTFGAEMSYRF